MKLSTIAFALLLTGMAAAASPLAESTTLNVTVFLGFIAFSLLLLVISFLARDKVVFVTLSGLFLLLGGLAMIQYPVTSVVNCLNDSGACESAVSVQNVSLPSGLNAAVALVITIFGIYLIIRAVLSYMDEAKAKKERKTVDED